MKLSYRYLTFTLSLRCLRRLKQRMRYVRAAGCIVADDEGHLLLIHRNGRWDLPKGKVEAGETLLQAALRETLEETGVQAVAGSRQPVAGSSPVKTYHIYNLYGGWHLKQTSWFRARAVGIAPQGTPQQEEGIAEVCWVDAAEWHRRLQSSYGTLRTLSSKLKTKS